MKRLRVVGSVAFAVLIVLGGLASYPAHSLSIVPAQRSQSSPSGGANLPHYTLGNVSLGSPGANPSAVVFDSQTGNVYVAVQPSMIDVISPRNNSVVATVNVDTPLREGPGGLALDDANGDLLVATQNGSILVFSPNSDSVVGAVPFGGYPILYDPVTNRVLASYGNGITVLNGTSLARLSSLPIARAVVLSYDPTTREIDMVGYEPFATI